MHIANIARRDVVIIILRYLSKEDMFRLQRVCQLWYREKIPTAMQMVSLPNDALRRKLIVMFTKNSATDDFKYPPFELNTLKKYWELLKTPQPFLDFDNSEYEEWDARSGCYAGMRHKKSAREHGIVSVRRPFGRILESGWIEGRQHGIARWLKKDGVQIELFSYGTRLAVIDYEADLTEKVREDPMNLLGDFQIQE